MEKPEIIPRMRIEKAIPIQDCSGKEYTKWEREDLIRYMLLAAEIQRDRDVDYYKRAFKTININQYKVKELKGGRVVINFNPALHLLNMNPNQAVDLGNLLVKHGKKARGNQEEKL